MAWREANAAFHARALAFWFELPAWHRAWIVATVETVMDINSIPHDS